MMKNTQEEKARKQMAKFQDAFIKLLSKNPEISVYGDHNGRLVANIPYGEGIHTRNVVGTLPSFVPFVPSK
jgi:hypothetical protein